MPKRNVLLCLVILLAWSLAPGGQAAPGNLTVVQTAQPMLPDVVRLGQLAQAAQSHLVAVQRDGRQRCAQPGSQRPDH